MSKAQEKQKSREEIHDELAKREYLQEQKRLERRYRNSGKILIPNMEQARALQDAFDHYALEFKVYVVGNLTVSEYEAMRRPKYNGDIANSGPGRRKGESRQNKVGYGCQTKHASRGVAGHHRCRKEGKRQFLRTCGISRDEAWKLMCEKKPNLEER